MSRYSLYLSLYSYNKQQKLCKGSTTRWVTFNEAVPDKIRQYRTDYNNNPPNNVSVRTPMTSTSGRFT